MRNIDRKDIRDGYTSPVSGLESRGADCNRARGRTTRHLIRVTGFHKDCNLGTDGWQAVTTEVLSDVDDPEPVG